MIQGLVSRLQQRDVRLFVEDGRLRVNAPEGALGDEQLAELRLHKQAIIDLLSATSSAVAEAPLPRAARTARMPCSFAQQRLWLVQRMSGASAAYNLPVALRLSGQLDVEAMQQSLAFILERHECLRTVIVVEQGEPSQRILPPAAFTLRLDEIGEEELVARARAHAMLVFDLETGPLFDARLLRLAAQEHVLLLNMHHVVSDGWSMGVLTNELCELYRARLEHRVPQLPPLQLQYADYACWQRDWLGGGELASQTDYWRQTLSGIPTLLDLPGDRLRPPQQSQRGATEALMLPAGLVDRLKDLARAERSTLFMVLLAAFNVLLARLSGESDVVVGTPVANRQRPELEPLIGFFVNTLALRNRIDQDMSFRGLLRGVRETTLQAFAHQDIPFEHLVEVLNPTRSLSHAPVFQSMFTLQNAPAGELVLPGLRVTPMALDGCHAKFDLSLSLEESAGGVAGVLEYATDLFDPATIRGWLADYAAILASALQVPDARLAEATPCEEAELTQRLAIGFGDVLPIPEDDLLPALLQRHAKQRPLSAAVVAGDRQLSHEQLQIQAARLAAVLHANGIGAEARVGVCLERSPEAAVAALAAWKLGAAYVPLDPSYPIERLRYICDDAGIACVIAAATTFELCEALSLPIVRVDERAADAADPSASATGDVAASGSRIHREQLAYVIYTSGSTGSPKGVMVAHGALRNLLAWYWRKTAISADDRCSQIAQSGFDASVWETWGCLGAGASLHIVDAETRLHPDRLVAWLAAQRITLSFMPTPLVEEVLATDLPLPASLRMLFVGGDRLKRHAPADAAWVLVNAYGPTEAAVVTITGDVAAASDTLIPIGRPTSNNRAYVLDASLHPVGPGMRGELYLAGASLGRGYLKRPGLTAERFLPDPFANDPGDRMYRTGDCVRWLRTGEMEFLGRVDQQVKLRGFRIELGEIEAALVRLSNVRDAVVAMRQAPSGEPALVAYVTPGDGEALDTPALQQALLASLPAYMVPSAWQVLAQLPLGPSGKLDRRALPEPDWQHAAARRVLPRNELEQALADIWSELLAVPTIGIHDDFFALGGHSLLATRVLARMRSRLGIELPLSALFNAPTIAALARELAALGPVDALASGPLLLPRAPRTGPLPLSFAQQRLWFLAQLDPASDAYHMPLVLRFRGALDVTALTTAIADLVRRQESLRARIIEFDGEPSQLFDQAIASLQVVDVTEDQIEARAAGLVSRPFELGAVDPLFRARLLRVDDAHHVLVMVLHHIVADGWSMGLFARELATLYRSSTAGCAPSLSALPVQYGDYAYWQRCVLGDAVLDRQLAYWTDKLAGAAERLDLPVDRPRSPKAPQASAVASLTLDAGLVASLRSLGQRRQATLFMTLLAAFKVLMQRLSGQDDICIGTPISNRGRPELEHIIGLFLGTLALRTRLDGAPTFEQCLARVRQTALDAYAHQDLPFERIVDALKLERDLGRHPLFQVFFNMLGQDDVPDIQLPGLVVSGIDPPEQASKFDFTLYATERDGGVDLQLQYNAHLFDADRMDEMLRQYRGLLAQAVAAPDRAIDHYSLRTHESARYLPNPVAPLDRTWRGAIPALFALQAAAHPGKEALRDSRMRLSYRELDEDSNRIAHRLRENMIGPGDVVALHAARRAELAVAMLAVTKVGAAFMILDAAYPDGRLRACLEAVAPAAWLTIGDATPTTPELEVALTDVPLRLSLADLVEVLATRPSSPVPAPVIGPDSLSHVAFTSGSTGRPKAVAGRHGPFTHFLPWFREHFDLGADDRFSVLSGLSHDPMQRDVLLPLMLGATACFPDPELMLPGQLAEWMREQAITVANLTPAMGRVLADVDATTTLPALRRAFVVGDVLTRSDVERLAELCPRCEIASFYGATETQWALGHHAARRDREDLPIMPLGRGFPGVQLLLLNRGGVVAGVGEVAEVCIRSPHVARGYWDGDASGNAHFVTNPFSGDPGDRIYRTGDLGRYAPDGEVRGLGRADRQVSIRGFRVELGEVESVLARSPAVAQAAVLCAGDHSGEARLVAFVVASAAADQPQAELAVQLRAHLREHLPDYMLPSALRFLPLLPVTSNGKLDRIALLALVPEAEATQQAYVAAATATERGVADIVETVLAREPIGVHDDFFALGGNSLSAMQVVSRLRQAFGGPIPVRQLFESPTIAGIARWLDARAGSGERAGDAVAIVARDVAQPLSFQQQRLWFLQRLDEDSTAYNMLLALRLRGDLDETAMVAALDDLVARHESLRTVFLETDGQAAQRVLAVGAGMEFDRAICAEAELEARIEQFAGTPFDLASSPPVRARMFRLAAAEHVLALSLHHIATDGWSMGILAGELAALYKARSTGTDVVLAPLPRQYLDYAGWQRTQLDSDELERQRAFWLDHLQGLGPLLPLPTDRPRPTRQSYRGGKVPLRIGPEMTGRLRDFCRAEGATEFMVLMAVYHVLLARYSGSDDIAVGFPTANRNRPELEAVVGFFANTLVLRTRPSAGLGFRDFLRQVREHTLAVYGHQDLPFESVVEMLQPERSLAHAPVFQVMFNLQNMPASAFELPGLAVLALPRTEEGARFDLTLVLREGGDGLSGALEYSSDLFDEATVERLAAHYQVLLASALESPQLAIAHLPLLTAAELAEFHASPATCPVAGEPVIEAFERWAAVAPAAEAVVFEGQALGYGEVNARANRLARRLRTRGVGREDRVGLLLPRSVDQVVAILAVLKAGAAYVPLDPDNPAERIRHVIGDAGLRWVLTVEALRHRLPDEAAEALCLDTIELSVEPGHNLDLPVSPAQLAYAIYTSGSSGAPKAAMLVHGGWSNLAAAQARGYGVRPGSRVLQLVSYAFDVAAGDFALALAHGATLVIAPDEARQAIERLRVVLQVERISHMQIPIALLAQLATDDLPALAAVIAGGEAMPADVVERWAGRVRLYNAYGPTEATVMATQGEQRTGDAVDIGTPIAGVRMYVLDARLQPLPRGVFGEMYIAGAGVGRGYLDRAGLTAANFLPDVGATAPGERMYRTGDIGRWRGNGKLEIRGRADQQIKLRGYRIEPGEIEAVLRDHPDVRDVAVTVREDHPGRRRLVAYVVPRTEPGIDAARLREHARARLMAYMVPAAWVGLAALPLTANGKLDHRALPAPVDEPSVAGHADRYTHASQPLLAGIWCRLLGRDSVGIHDNFFQLGGDSILSIQVVSLAAQAGWKITPKQMFECQTIAQLSSMATPVVAVDSEQGEVTGVLPFTPIQRWFFDTVTTARQHWNQGVLLQPDAAIEFGAVAQVVAELQRHHDALRLRVAPSGEDWQQHIAPAAEAAALQRIVLAAGSATVFADLLTEQASAIQTGFELSGQGLFRAIWFESADGAHRRLWLLAHHLIVDALSWRILLEDLQSGLRLLAAGEPLCLPPKTSSYRHWAQRLQSHAGSVESRVELAYWEQMLDRDYPALPMDGSGLNTDASADKLTVELTEEQTRELLQGTGHAYGTGINEVLLTALAVAYRDWSGNSMLLIALEGHGRDALFDDVDVSRTVGWFTVNQPLGLVVPASEDPVELIQSIASQLAAAPRKGVGYGLLRYLAGAEELSRFNEQAPISFNYLGQFDQVMQANGLLVPGSEPTGLSRDPAQQRPHEIDLVGLVSGGVFAMDFRYGRNRFGRDNVLAFAEAFRAALLGLLGHCAAQQPVTHDPAVAAELALVALQPDGIRPPLFCVHPAGGSVGCYRPLADALGSSQPVYGLQAPALAGGTVPLPSFEAMAAFYIAAMRQRQPRGPYRLLGWSQGGTIAFEIAKQLARAGESVAFLGLVDSGYSKQMLHGPGDADESVQLLEHLALGGFTITGDEPPHASPPARFDWLVEHARAQGHLADGLDAPALRRLVAMQHEIATATEAYVPSGYRGDAVLFCAVDDHLFGHLGDRLGWASEIAADWCRAEVPGDHFSCVQPPHVATLAARLRDFLDRDGRESSDGPDHIGPAACEKSE